MKSLLLSSILLAGAFAFAVVLDSPEAFFYNVGFKRGYELGSKEGFVKGYKQALEDVKTILKAYALDIRALEAGKYLYERNLVTYPRVFRVKDEEGYKIVVKGCKIEDVRSLDEIFRSGIEIPVLEPDLPVKVRQAQANILRLPELSQRVEEATKVPPAPIFVVVSPSATDLLERYNIPYVIEGRGEEKIVKAVFFDEKEANEFCMKHEVCGGEDELEGY